MGVSISVFDDIAAAELAATNGPYQFVIETISITEVALVASGAYPFFGMQASSYRNGLLRTGYSGSQMPITLSTGLSRFLPRWFFPGLGSSSAGISSREFEFETPPLRPGEWTFAVQPRDNKLELGNPSPNAVKVTHDLISYWQHANPFDPNNECMVLGFNDATSILTITLQPSPDFVLVGLCADESIGVAESVSITIA